MSKYGGNLGTLNKHIAELAQESRATHSSNNEQWAGTGQPRNFKQTYCRISSVGRATHSSNNEQWVGTGTTPELLETTSQKWEHQNNKHIAELAQLVEQLIRNE